MAKKEEGEGRATEWTPFGELETSDFIQENREDVDEEIIDLVDVVEEPESRLSIDQFVAPEGSPEKLDLFSTEPWARPFDLETPEERGAEGGLEGVSEEELLEGLELKAQEIEEPLAAPAAAKEGAAEVKPSIQEEVSEEGIFEKLELEEILEKVEQLKPALEKEWPEEEGQGEVAMEGGKGPPSAAPEPLARGDWFSGVEEKPPGAGKAALGVEETERPMDFDEFQALLKKDLGLEAPEEATVPSLSAEEERAEPAEDVEAGTRPVTTKDLEALLEEVAVLEAGPQVGGEPPSKEESLGEPSGLAEFEALLQKGVEPEPASEESLPPFAFEEEVREEVLEGPLFEKASLEQELPELGEEAFPEALIEAIEEDVEEEVLERGEISEIQEGVEERAEELTELPTSTPFQGEEMVFRFEEVGKVEPPSEVGPVPIPPPLERVSEAAAAPLGMASRQLQESIARGVQEMIGDFITKILPEMTQEILQLTTERIEKMVKEIVPEMAEKAIRREIERIEKGEK